MKLHGRIKEICPAKSGTSQRTGEQWTSQSFVLEYFETEDDNWPQTLAFSVFGQDKLNEVDLHINDEVDVYVQHRAVPGKDGQWFNDIKAGRITKTKAVEVKEEAHAAPSAPAQPASPLPPLEGDQQTGQQNDGDDLPF